MYVYINIHIYTYIHLHALYGYVLICYIFSMIYTDFGIFSHPQGALWVCGSDQVSSCLLGGILDEHADQIFMKRWVLSLKCCD
jgi:hypothetical protein